MLFSTAVKIFDGIVAALQPIVDAFKKAFDITDTVESSFDPLKLFGDILSGITDIISFVGDVLVELGGFLVEFLIAPMKLGFTVVSLLIQPLVDLGKWIFNVGESTKKTGGFFSDFIDIVKQAPEFIRAVTAGFSAFVGSITDLITNSSFEKLGKVLKAEAFGEAFGSSMGQSAVKKANETLLGGFEGSMKKLSDLAEKINLSNSEQEKRFNLAAQELQRKFNKVDFEAEKELLSAKSKQQKDAIEKRVAAQKEAITKDYEAQKKAITKDLELQKEKDKVSFNTEKVRINDQITAKLAAKEIDKKTEEKLRAQLLDINLAAETKADAANKAKDDKASKDKKSKLNSLKDENEKTEEEIRKLRGESDTALIEDELDRAKKANEEKFLAAQRAVQKEIAETKAMKDVSESDRLARLALLEIKENTILEIGLNQRDEIIRKHNQKQIDDDKKANEELAKNVAEFNKKADAVNAELDKKEAEATRKSIEERIAAEEKYAETHKSIFQQLADNTIDIFKGISDGFTQAFTTDDSAAKEASNTARKAADAQLTELKKSLKDKLISFSDYQDKITDINRQIEESGAESGKTFGDKFVDGLNKSLGAVGRVFENMGKSVLNQYDADNKELAGVNRKLNKEISNQEKFKTTDTIDQAAERKKKILELSQQQADGQISTSEQLDVVLKTLAFSASTALVSAAAAGQNMWDAFVLSTLDAMNALIPLFTAMIMGKQLAELGPFGLLAAGGLIAVMATLVAAARAEVSANGFYQGGYTGDGSDNTVKGVVHEEEYVFSKKAVKRDVSAFDELHNTLKNGVTLSEIMKAYKYPELSTTLVGTAGIVQNYSIAPVSVPTVSNNDIVSELRELKRVQESVLSATEQMPTVFRGNVKHEFNITHDPSLAVKKMKYNDRRKALQ